MSDVCYIFLAEGFEEIEALTVVDLLRRESINIKMVSITGDKCVTGSHGIKVFADVLIEDINADEASMLILPGGMPGTNYLKECKVLTDKILDFNEKGKKIAAICAAPTVFGALGILEGKDAVCFPGLEDKLTGAKVRYDEVVTCGNITTSRGMGTAIAFGLEIVKILKDEKSSEDLGKKIVYKQ